MTYMIRCHNSHKSAPEFPLEVSLVCFIAHAFGYTALMHLAMMPKCRPHAFDYTALMHLAILPSCTWLYCPLPLCIWPYCPLAFGYTALLHLAILPSCIRLCCPHVLCTASSNIPVSLSVCLFFSPNFSYSFETCCSSVEIVLSGLHLSSDWYLS